jgi:hypothetical protein
MAAAEKAVFDTLYLGRARREVRGLTRSAPRGFDRQVVVRSRIGHQPPTHVIHAIRVLATAT